jgi:hypothetical protein
MPYRLLVDVEVIEVLDAAKEVPDTAAESVPQDSVISQ